MRLRIGDQSGYAGVKEFCLLVNDRHWIWMLTNENIGYDIFWLIGWSFIRGHNTSIITDLITQWGIKCVNPSHVMVQYPRNFVDVCVWKDTSNIKTFTSFDFVCDFLSFIYDVTGTGAVECVWNHATIYKKMKLHIWLIQTFTIHINNSFLMISFLSLFITFFTRYTWHCTARRTQKNGTKVFVRPKILQKPEVLFMAAVPGVTCHVASVPRLYLET